MTALYDGSETASTLQTILDARPRNAISGRKQSITNPKAIKAIIPAIDYAFIECIGHGNISEGVRIAISLAHQTATIRTTLSMVAPTLGFSFLYYCVCCLTQHQTFTN